MKKLSYLFPSGNPNELKIFEDNTSTIRGYYYKRSVYKKLKEYDNMDSACIYFLLYTDSEDVNHIYIGQSVNGFNRIDNHNINKDYWNEGYLFNSTNGSWSKTIIDYLEYYYIEFFKGTEYALENSGARLKPAVGIYEQADIDEYIRQLDFLLLANGITHPQEEVNELNYKIYQNSSYNAKLIQKDGSFILLKNSEIKRPVESSKNWINTTFYANYSKKVNDLIEANFVIIEEEKLITTEDIEFQKLATATNLVTGATRNGREFWGIDREN